MKRHLLPSMLPSSEEMAALDAATIASGVPSITLMERAGKEILRCTQQHFPSYFRPKSKARFVVVCGPGNNGGDGFVIARELLRRRMSVTVIVAAAKNYSADCQAEALAFTKKGGLVHLFPKQQGRIKGVSFTPLSAQKLKDLMAGSDLIFDALLGTGQADAPRGGVLAILNSVLPALASISKRPTVVAVDLPTGVNGSSGAVFTPHLEANLTVTVQGMKRGMVQYPARTVCGEVDVVDAGIKMEGSCEYALLTRDSAPSFPVRSKAAHKGIAGRVLVVGGSIPMPGAPVLASLAALRSGAGLVTTTRFDPASSSGRRPLEVIDLPVAAGISGGFHPGNLKELKVAASRCDVLVFGPGIGRSDEAVAFSELFIKEVLKLKLPAVVDADALVNLSVARKLRLSSQIIITPHAGEAATLLRCTPEAVQADRYSAARTLHQNTGAVVVLKGASSIIYEANRGVVNTSGNEWMATAGSGDVLCGIIAALLGQGKNPYDAAALGVYLHGAAGDAAHSEHMGPIIASDITRKIPFVIGKLRQ